MSDSLAPPTLCIVFCVEDCGHSDLAVICFDFVIFVCVIEMWRVSFHSCISHVQMLYFLMCRQLWVLCYISNIRFCSILLHYVLFCCFWNETLRLRSFSFYFHPWSVKGQPTAFTWSWTAVISSHQFLYNFVDVCLCLQPADGGKCELS